MELKLEKGKRYWTNVTDYPEDFMVSSDGQVFSLRTDKELKLHKNKKGYLNFVTRIGGRKAKAICLKVHILVAKAFVPNPHNHPFVNHLDGDKTNNQWWNLEWCDCQRNVQHAWDIGLHPRKKRTRKLTDAEVGYLVANPDKLSQRKLAKKLGIARMTAQEYIRLRKRYGV